MGIVLSLAGHHAIFAKDVDEVVVLFECSSIRFDFIITDRRIVSGLDIMRSLRAKGFPVEVMVLTASDGTIDDIELKKFASADIFEKQFDTTALRKWIECIRESHAASSAGENPPCPPWVIDFCWVKRDP